MSTLPSDMHRRLGRFAIHNVTLMNAPQLAVTVLAGCIVVRAEAIWHGERIEYVACHPDFDPVRPGEDAPAYVWTLDNKFERVWLKANT